ncbi:hypothetical protein PIB30_053416 [Stylosanthes scabra]|uniref:Uncharacterized protein n=1 Tax=Stylosanthes scabra TaxID=79078 RepID=A0ABU6XHL5_9FABA|nr:hypothetical protein [Stylosanthes scabra]
MFPFLLTVQDQPCATASVSPPSVAGRASSSSKEAVKVQLPRVDMGGRIQVDVEAERQSCDEAHGCCTIVVLRKGTVACAVQKKLVDYNQEAERFGGSTAVNYLLCSPVNDPSNPRKWEEVFLNDEDLIVEDIDFSDKYLALILREGRNFRLCSVKLPLSTGKLN